MKLVGIILSRYASTKCNVDRHAILMHARQHKEKYEF